MAKTWAKVCSRYPKALPIADDSLLVAHLCCQSDSNAVAIRCKSLAVDMEIAMEDSRYRMVAIETEDPRCRGLLRGVVFEMEDFRCKSLVNRVVVAIEDPRCNRVAIKTEDPRCKSLFMTW